MPDRITVGNVEIIGFLDMIPPAYSPTEFFPDVPMEAWEPYKADHLENCEHNNCELQLYYGCFALRSQGQVVLVDTGIGPGPHPTRGNLRGDLLNQIKLQGINPEDVVTVVHTHVHIDHVGWNVTYEGGRATPTFPRARYLVPKADWEHFTRPEIMETAPYARDSVVPLEGLGVMELIEGEYTITPEISTVPTPGHTPGHINVLITSQGEKGAVVGDMLHSKVQVQEPEWSSRADIDKGLGVRSRQAMLERFEKEDFVVAAGHFKTNEHFGKVIRLEGRRYWQVLYPG